MASSQYYATTNVLAEWFPPNTRQQLMYCRLLYCLFVCIFFKLQTLFQCVNQHKSLVYFYILKITWNMYIVVRRMSLVEQEPGTA
jgi:hypothetical protein